MGHPDRLAIGIIAVTLASMQAAPAAAEVLSVSGNGFEIRETAHTAGSPEKVYAALLLPARGRLLVRDPAQRRFGRTPPGAVCSPAQNIAPARRNGSFSGACSGRRLDLDLEGRP
jgi:hypothetical protein